MIKIFYTILQVVYLEGKVKNQRGATMVEILGVLGVLGVLAGSVWKLVGSAWMRYRISNGASQIQSLQRNISRFYASKGNYNDLEEVDAVATLISEKVIPKNMCAGSDAIRHAFGGSVELANVVYSNEMSSASTSYSITFKNLSNSVCMEMLQLKWPETDNANLISISAGGMRYTWPSYSNGDTYVLPVTMQNAMISCYGENNSNKGGTVDITWEFK